MIALIIFLACVFAALGAGVLGAWSDYKGLKIANIYTLVVLAAFGLSYGALYLLPSPDVFFPLLSYGLAALIVFAVTALMFTFKALGAADSKLGTAFALWVGLQGLPVFLFWMAVTGGLLGVVALILQKKKPIANPPEGSWVAQVQAGKSKVPYGIAIAVGAVMAFIHVGYLSPEILQNFLK